MSRHPEWTVIDHVREAEAWIKDMAEDQSVSEDEIAWDIIMAYADTELGGRGTPMGKELLRVMLGVV